MSLFIDKVQYSRFTTAELVNIETKLTDARFKSLNIELEIYESGKKLSSKI